MVRRCVVGAGLGLVMAWAAPAAAGAAPPATATPPPTLTGEVLPASRCCFLRDEGPIIIGSTTFPQEVCDDQTNFDRPLEVSFTASGPASDTASRNPPPPAGTEPYPGTYHLTATITFGPGIHLPEDHPRYYKREITGFSGTFHIQSAGGQVDGVTQLVPDSGAILNCYLRQGGWMTVPLRYTATIAPAVGGLFRDTGGSFFDLYYNEDPLIESLSETFSSDLAAPQPLLTQRSECLHGGWQSYEGRFNNQGECVRLVQRGP